MSIRLSVVIPVYNERDTIREIIRRVKAVDIQKEIIIVDDFSTDGTREILKSLEADRDPEISFFYLERNEGKGAALRAGFKRVRGDYVVIQDADLEYDPEDYHKLFAPIEKGRARVVYGSRFTGERKNMFFLHWIGNRFLTLVTNVLFNTTISDMETCYKLIPADLLRAIDVKAKRFNFEPEITAKILKRGIRIYEVPISYAGREYSEGKKITWRDGFSALITLVKYRFLD
ncbi:MAG: glycosyltransferase family 2 protein [Deltaproteobacteria bacterium]